jgi:hypothetical protein
MSLFQNKLVSNLTLIISNFEEVEENDRVAQ